MRYFLPLLLLAIFVAGCGSDKKPAPTNGISIKTRPSHSVPNTKSNWDEKTHQASLDSCNQLGGSSEYCANLQNCLEEGLPAQDAHDAKAFYEGEKGAHPSPRFAATNWKCRHMAAGPAKPGVYPTVELDRLTLSCNTKGGSSACKAFAFCVQDSLPFELYLHFDAFDRYTLTEKQLAARPYVKKFNACKKNL